MAEINPILVRELRGRMRGSRPFVLFSIYLLVLSGVAMLLYIAAAGSIGSDLNAGRQIGRTLFLVIGGVALIEVCVITPIITAGAVAGERERQTFDLIVGSMLTPWQIVWGKLAAGLGFAMLLVLTVIPVLSLSFLFGGVSGVDMLIAIAILSATVLLYASIGLFWSTVARSPLGAAGFALGTVLLLLLGIPFIALMFTLIFRSDLTGGIFDTPLFVIVSRIFVSLHPFLAAALTESELSGGRGPFFNVDQVAGTEITTPSPWLLYVCLSILGSALLALLSLRSIRPDD